MRFCPVLGIAALCHAEDHFRQSGEGQIVDVGRSVGQVHILQVLAVLEGIAADGGHALGEIDALQAGAVLKGRTADHLQAAVLGKYHLSQAAAAAEGVGRQLGHTLADDHLGNHRPVAVPGDIGLAGVDSHAACAGDSQNTVAAQRPGQVAAAAAGGHLNGRTFHISYSLGNRPILGIAVIAHAENDICVSIKGIGHNGAYAVRQINRRKSGAVRKGVIADIAYTFRQRQCGQTRATGKGILLDTG